MNLTEDPDLSIYLSFEGDKKIMEKGEGVVPKIIGSAIFQEGIKGKSIYFGTKKSSYLDVGSIQEHLNLEKETALFWFRPHWNVNDDSKKHALMYFKMKSKDQSRWLAFYQFFYDKAPAVLCLIPGITPCN